MKIELLLIEHQITQPTGKDWFIILEQSLEIPAIVCLTQRKENDKKIRKLVLRPFEEGN